jgi:hypothetical protein
MTGEEEQTIPVDPRTVDWTKTMQHEREVIWKNWATYQEDLVKARDEVIKRDNEKFGIFTAIANETEEELQHYKDMLFYLLHRPYKPKPKSNKRNTKNRGKDTCSCFGRVDVCVGQSTHWTDNNCSSFFFHASKISLDR